MNTFTELDIPKHYKIGVTGITGYITKREHSRKFGQTRTFICQLAHIGYNAEIIDPKDNWDKYDMVIFFPGSEYKKNSLNLFGGLSESFYDYICNMINFKGLRFLYSINNVAMPDFNSTIQGRLSNKTTYHKFNELESPRLHQLSTTPIFTHVYYSNSLLVSDSHGIGVWEPPMMIDTCDGRTLFGMLKDDNLVKTVNQYKDINALTINLGNIDVRFHIMRQANPLDALRDLIRKLCLQIKNTGINDVTITHLLPIENESRKIPNSGDARYKGEPFYGTRLERQSIVDKFNKAIDHVCTKTGWKTIAHPESFLNELGELSFDVMERPKSVHISPKYFKYNVIENKNGNIY